MSANPQQLADAMTTRLLANELEGASKSIVLALQSLQRGDHTVASMLLGTAHNHIESARGLANLSNPTATPPATDTAIEV